MSLGAITLDVGRPGERLDQAARMVSLLEGADARIRRNFLRLVADSRTLASLSELARLLQAGRLEEALRISDEIAPNLVSQLEGVYQAAGVSAAAAVRGQAETLFNFSMANSRAVQDLQRTRLRLVREFRQEQRAASQLILQDAFQRGLPPIQQARALRGSIGLTRHQANQVLNYRRLLERRDAAALRRALRDRRFDSTLRQAIRADRPLTRAQIDRMVGRYQERYVQLRARTIARTESLQAASAADHEAYAQAIESQALPPDAITQVWHARFRNTRDTHKAMHRQTQPWGVPFESPSGAKLRYPGDERAPAAETINCQCVVAREVQRSALRRATQRPTVVV